MTEIVAQLKGLKLNGMANSYAELISQGQNASMQISEWLIKHLIEAETTYWSPDRHTARGTSG